MLDPLHLALDALRDELAPLAICHLDAASQQAPAGNFAALTATATARDFAERGDFDDAAHFVEQAIAALDA